MQIPLVNEHLFYKYFVRLTVGNATKGFATYGCCHPCLNSLAHSSYKKVFYNAPFSLNFLFLAQNTKVL